MRLLVRTSILSFALALAAGPAVAKKKVVITAFSGSGGSAARAGLIRGLKRRAKLVSAKSYTRTASNLGVNAAVDKGKSAIAAHLKLSAIVEGRVKRKRRRFRLTVVVFDGRTGAELGQRTFQVRKKRHLRRAGMKAARYVASLLPQAQVGEVAPPPPPPPPPPKPEPEPDDDAQAKAEAEAMRKKADDDARLKAEADAGDRPRGLIQLSAAFGFAMRSYKLDAQDANNNREYDGGLYPEVSLALETYPLLLATKGALSGLGLGASFTHHLSISTEQQATSESVGSSSMSFSVDLRYRWLFSHSAFGPVAYGRAGFGMRSFDLDDNPTLTSFSYQFIDIALGGRVPIGSPLFAVEAEVALRPILKAGQEAVDAFGERSGGLGFGARAGFSGYLALGVFYFAMFEYLTFPSDFAGLPDKVRPIELSEPSSGSDSFIRFWLGAGYAH